jgi:hypothetical protein
VAFKTDFNRQIPCFLSELPHFFESAFRSKCAAGHFDRLGIAEVHKHLANGERDLHRWIEEYKIGSGR